MARKFSFGEFRHTAPIDDYLTPVDQRFHDPERDIHDAPLDCATLQAEMLATLAVREAGRRRWAAIQLSRKVK